MKPPEKKVKGTFVAKSIKKLERNLNNSGNKSFLNKSNSLYIADLRNNNAKLAHALAQERMRFGTVFRKYREVQTQMMNSHAMLRNVSHSVKVGMTKWRSALDQLIEATDIFCGVTNTIATFCPEQVEPDTSQGGSGNPVAALSADPNSSATDSVPTSDQCGVPSSPVTPSIANNAVSVEQGPVVPQATLVPSVRHSSVRPMVKGQVICNPTISLQRVSLPTRQLGKCGGKPSRGVLLAPPGGNRSRLSAVAEEVNESAERLSVGCQSSKRSNSPPVKGTEILSPKIPSLPASHVLLERIEPNINISAANLSPNADASKGSYEQLTVVHFGKLNFSIEDSVSSSPPRSSPHPPEKLPNNSVCRSDVGSEGRKSKRSADQSKSASNPKKSDQYSADSSSEDEGLALQLAESRKCYLERDRQLDGMEGTSWNYDAAGKFREQPPKTSKAKKLKKSRATPGRGEASSTHVTQVVSPKQVPKPNVVRGAQRNASGSGSNPSGSDTLDQPLGGLLSDTIVGEKDMSFTECVGGGVLSEVGRNTTKCQESESPKGAGDLGPLETLDSGDNLSERAVYVTYRSQRRKTYSKSPGALSRSIISSSKQRNCPELENIENSPPISLQANAEVLQVEKKTTPIRHIDLSQKRSYVVLERLPSAVLYGSTSQVVLKNSDLPRSSKRKEKSTPNYVAEDSEVAAGMNPARSRSSPRRVAQTLGGSAVRSGVNDPTSSQVTFNDSSSQGHVLFSPSMNVKSVELGSSPNPKGHVFSARRSKRSRRKYVIHSSCEDEEADSDFEPPQVILTSYTKEDSSISSDSDHEETEQFQKRVSKKRTACISSDSSEEITDIGKSVKTSKLAKRAPASETMDISCDSEEDDQGAREAQLPNAKPGPKCSKEKRKMDDKVCSGSSISLPQGIQFVRHPDDVKSPRAATSKKPQSKELPESSKQGYENTKDRTKKDQTGSYPSHNAHSLSVPATSTMPSPSTSPMSARSDCSYSNHSTTDENHGSRPRRNAAPTNLQEPSLHTKLRRE